MFVVAVVNKLQISHQFRFSFAVSNSRQIRNIALIGFMGTGKTSVGRLLAEQLHYEFVDTDEFIETRTGKKVTDIFKQDGEPTFRKLEVETIAELAAKRKQVISCGGGLAANQANIDQLKSHALVVCLWAAPEKIYQRVRHQTHRPLLHDPDPLQKIRDLLAAREPFYRQADVMVNTELRPVNAVAQQVVYQFHLAQKETR